MTKIHGASHRTSKRASSKSESDKNCNFCANHRIQKPSKGHGRCIKERCVCFLCIITKIRRDALSSHNQLHRTNKPSKSNQTKEHYFSIELLYEILPQYKKIFGNNIKRISRQLKKDLKCSLDIHRREKDLDIDSIDLIGISQAQNTEEPAQKIYTKLNKVAQKLELHSSDESICNLCKIHGVIDAYKNHVCIYETNCNCILCVVTKVKRDAVSASTKLCRARKIGQDAEDEVIEELKNGEKDNAYFKCIKIVYKMLQRYKNLYEDDMNRVFNQLREDVEKSLESYGSNQSLNSTYDILIENINDFLILPDDDLLDFLEGNFDEFMSDSMMMQL